MLKPTRQTVLRLAVFLGAFLFFASSSLADISLPKPQQSGGDGIFKTLKNRSSFPQNNLPKKAVSQQDLSTLLWAATGLNRENKWTTPFARGSEPYNRVYIIDDKGVFLYDWKSHALKEISKENIKAQVAMQSFVAEMPVLMVFVSDGDLLEKVGSAYAPSFPWIAAGAMTQNVYLAAASLNIGARYLASIKTDILKAKLRLKNNDMPLAIMAVGGK